MLGRKKSPSGSKSPRQTLMKKKSSINTRHVNISLTGPIGKEAKEPPKTARVNSVLSPQKKLTKKKQQPPAQPKFVPNPETKAKLLDL